ncbi:MAG: class I SAM-dependent methyltransferase [Thermoleophilaceae bacterium]
MEAVNAHTLIACEHMHRYRFAAQLCAGLRVLDLACGTGYGSAILRETASGVHGVDLDAGTVDTARVTIGSEHDVTFEAADAAECLRRELSDFDAIVCFEGLEHLPDPADALQSLRRHAAGGRKLILSVPNSRGLGERNEFHATDFGYDEVRSSLEGFGEVTLLYQFLAEGSLIRGRRPSDVEGAFMLDEHGEPEYANHFIACVNLGEELRARPDLARMQLTVAPNYNRHIRNIEHANAELWRENARIARARLGVSDSAAAALLARVEEMRRQKEAAEDYSNQLDLLIADLRRQLLIFGTPRHQALERARERLMRHRLPSRLGRAAWALVRR